MSENKNSDLDRYLLENSLEHFSDLVMLQRNYIENQERRIQHLENILWLFQYRETVNKTGLALKINEFYNTILRSILLGETKKERAEPLEEKILRSERKISDWLGKIAEKFAINPSDNFPNIYIDVTGSLLSLRATGIERLVAALALAGAQFEAKPVLILKKNIYYYDFNKNKFLTFNFKKDDIFLMPDMGWHYTDSLLEIMTKVELSGGKNITLLCDMVPIYMPTVCAADVPFTFSNWIKKCVLKSNNVICISKATATDLLNYLKSSHVEGKVNIKSVGWSHPGIFSMNYKGENSIENSPRCLSVSTPFFLSVGTIEPRKGHLIALEAFEKLWKEGVDVSYVIIGGRGWQDEKIVNKITSSKFFDKKLFWFDRIEDTEISYFYKNARALIMPSLKEGYGLPIKEAEYFGLPSIVSDIDVFREIADVTTTYFKVANSDDLFQKICETLNCEKQTPKKLPRDVQEFVKEIFGMIYKDNYQISVS